MSNLNRLQCKKACIKITKKKDLHNREIISLRYGFHEAF